MNKKELIIKFGNVGNHGNDINLIWKENQFYNSTTSMPTLPTLPKKEVKIVKIDEKSKKDNIFYDLEVQNE